MKESKSDIGVIIDYPIDDFKKEIVSNHVPIGIINNLVLLLEGYYEELRQRKEALMNKVFQEQNTKEEMQPYLTSIYCEMVKIEQKVVYLKDRSKELGNLDIPTS